MHFKKGALSLLLVLAMLTLLFAAILPVAADDPEPEEIQNFGFQSSANFAVAGAVTEMRFVFTIGSLDYTKVGFVFAFESYLDGTEDWKDEDWETFTPEVGADGCHTVEATAAYKTINADGKAQPAPDRKSVV